MTDRERWSSKVTLISWTAVKSLTCIFPPKIFFLKQTDDWEATNLSWRPWWVISIDCGLNRCAIQFYKFYFCEGLVYSKHILSWWFRLSKWISFSSLLNAEDFVDSCFIISQEYFWLKWSNKSTNSGLCIVHVGLRLLPMLTQRWLKTFQRNRSSLIVFFFVEIVRVFEGRFLTALNHF